MSSITEFNSVYPSSDMWESLNGKIGFYKGTGNNWLENRYGGKPAICIQYHGSIQWIPLGMLSGANYKKYRRHCGTSSF